VLGGLVMGGGTGVTSAPAVAGHGTDLRKMEESLKKGKILASIERGV